MVEIHCRNNLLKDFSANAFRQKLFISDLQNLMEHLSWYVFENKIELLRRIYSIEQFHDVGMPLSKVSSSNLVRVGEDTQKSDFSLDTLLHLGIC